MRLEIHYRKKPAKNTNTWSLHNMLVNNQWITEEIKEINSQRQMKTKTQGSKMYGPQLKQF